MRRLLLVLGFFLVACQFEEPPAPGRLSTTTAEKIVSIDNTSEPPTQIPTTIATSTPLPEPSVTSTPPSTPTTSSSPTPFPTSDPFSIMASDETSLLLENRIEVSEEFLEDDIVFHRVSGWDEGFRPVGYCKQGAIQWLDESHLLLFPVVDKKDSGFGPYLLTRPMVMNADTGDFWLVPIADSVDCELPAWSDTMQSLIVLWRREFLVLNVQGDILARFSGRGNPHLSPSGSKFFADNTWYDLQTGQTKIFHDGDPGSFISENRYHDSPPGWSGDETRLARGLAIADADTGETFFIKEPNEAGGHGGAPGMLLDPPIYFLNDNLVFFDTPFMQAGKWVIPLIDLQARELVDIHTIVGVDPEITCSGLRNIDSKSFLLVNCDRIWYVVNPQTMTMDSRFPFSVNAPIFSPDDRYAVLVSPESQYLLWENGNLEFYELDISPLATPYESSYMRSPPIGRWSPQTNWFLFWTEEFEVLSFLNPITKEISSISFPYANGKMMQEFWAPSEDQVALLDTDGSLWWVSDLSGDGEAELVNPPDVTFMGEFWQEDQQTLLLYDENGRFWKFSFADARLEQLTTTPFETIHINSVKFSPEGTKVAFVVGAEVEEYYSIEGSEVVIVSLESEE